MKNLIFIFLLIFLGCSTPLVKPTIQDPNSPPPQELTWGQKLDGGFEKSREVFQRYKDGFDKERQRIWNKYWHNKCE